MAELLLYIALVDLGRGGEASGSEWPENFWPRSPSSVAAHAGSNRRALDQSRHLLVVQSLGADSLALAGDASK